MTKGVIMKRLALLALLLLALVACAAPEPIRVTPTVGPGTPTQVPPTSTPAIRPTRTPKTTPTPTARPLVSCAKLHPDFVDRLDDIAAEWDDANAIATASPRMSLAAPLAKLQEIRREAVDLAEDAPECGQDAAVYIVVYMDFTIEAMLEFLGGDDPSATSIRLVGDAIDEYGKAYEGLHDDVWSE